MIRLLVTNVKLNLQEVERNSLLVKDVEDEEMERCEYVVLRPLEDCSIVLVIFLSSRRGNPLIRNCSYEF